jgi:hypothetical protein
MLLLIELVLTVVAWRKGWKAMALVPQVAVQHAPVINATGAFSLRCHDHTSLLASSVMAGTDVMPFLHPLLITEPHNDSIRRARSA